MKTHAPPFLLVFSLLLGCSAPIDPVLARWSGGEVLQSDLDRELQMMTEDERHFRQAQQVPDEKTRVDLIRRVALRGIAKNELAATAMNIDPQISEEARIAARTWWLARWRQTCYGLPMELPDPGELKAELKQRELPRRRRLSHIFLRAEGPDEIETARRKLDSWRSGIDDLESFADLARTQSDSESRFRGGRLGWIREGWLTWSAEEILFELEPGTISRPIVMRGGVHIFFIEAAREAEVLPQDRQLARLKATKKTEVLDGCRDQSLDAARIALSLDTDAEWPNITIGDWSITSEVLQSLYNDPGRDPAEIVDRLTQDEILFQTSIEKGAPNADELLRMNDLKDNVWLTHLIKTRVEESISPPPTDELRERFDANPARYRKQSEFEVEVLSTTIPTGVDPMVFWEELTSITRALSAGRTRFVDAVSSIGGDAYSVRQPMATTREIAGLLGPVVFERIKNTPPGEIVGPIQDGPRFSIVAVHDRESGRPMTFDEARPRLRAEILGERRAEARSSIARAMLESRGFKLLTTTESESDDASPSSS